MGLLPQRIKRKVGFSSPKDAFMHLNILLKHGDIIHFFDAIEEAIEYYPSYAMTFLVPAYEVMNELENKSRYEQYQSRIFEFPIKAGDKVLDMGSGHLPFPLATHLADISLNNDDIGRAGIPLKHVDGKPIYECSVERTPFADKEFDFVYCSHVLEHAENPEAACNELMRIGKRGYIETPTRAKDFFLVMAEISHHKNYVELEDGVLTFRRYKNDEIKGIGYNILLQMCCNPKTDREKAFSTLLNIYPSRVNTMLLWEDKFDFKVLI